MRKIDLNDETGRSNPFIISDPCKLFTMSQAKEIMIERNRESIRTQSLVERADVLKPPVPTGATSQRQTRAITSYTSVRPGYKSDVLKQSGRITDFIRQKREIYKIQLLLDQKRKEIDYIYNYMKTEEQNWEDKDREIDNLGVKYKCISVQADNIYVDQKMAFEHARTNRINLQAKLKKKKRDILDLKEEHSKDLITLKEYQSYLEFLKIFLPKGKELFVHFNTPKQIETELLNEQKENLFLISNCIELERQINNSREDFEQSLKNIERLIANIKPIIGDAIPNIPFQPSKKQFQSEFDSRKSEISEITEKVRVLYDKFFEHDNNMNALVMLQRINTGLENLYEKSKYLDPKTMSKKQAQINKDRRDQQRTEQMRNKEIMAQIKKEQAIERANKPIMRRTGRPVIARSIIPKVIKNNDEELRLKALAEKRQNEMLFGGFE